MKGKLFFLLTLIAGVSLELKGTEFEIVEIIDANNTPFSRSIGQKVFRQLILKSNLSKQEKNTLNYFMGCLYFMGKDQKRKKVFQAMHEEIGTFLSSQDPSYLKERELEKIFAPEGLFSLAIDENFYKEEIEDSKDLFLQYWEEAEKNGCPLSRHTLAWYERVYKQDFGKAAKLYLKNNIFFLSIYELACMRENQAIKIKIELSENKQSDESSKVPRLTKSEDILLLEMATKLFKKNFKSNKCILSLFKFNRLSLEENRSLKDTRDFALNVIKEELCKTKEQKRALAILLSDVGYGLFQVSSYYESRNFYKQAIGTGELGSNLPLTFVNLAACLWMIHEKEKNHKTLQEKKKDLREIDELLSHVSLVEMPEKDSVVETILFLHQQVKTVLQEVGEPE